ncbi:hypothetical protein [Polaribacter sp. P097]|uniref:hypothetical protein n=1 Tax=Polaribacter sp. P097 TaxID=3117398 RepID=UPI002FE33F85
MKVFKEEQRFTQTWLIVLMGFSLVVPLVLITREFLKENSEFTVGGFLGVVGVLIASIVPIFFFKLITRIDEVGIHYRFFPFHFKTKRITWQEIEKVYVRIYDPIGDYGGWGLKGGFLWNKSKGIAINVSGDIGIQLELKTGKKILIGTQKKQEATSVIETYTKKL